MSINCHERFQTRAVATFRSSETIAQDVIAQTATLTLNRPLHRVNNTVIVDRRSLVRDCLAKGLENAGLVGTINAFSSVREWMRKSDQDVGATIMLLSTDGRSIAEMRSDWSEAMLGLVQLPTLALLTDDQQSIDVREALQAGVRGYILSSMPLNDVVDALQLIQGGGIFVPASCFAIPPVIAEVHSTRDTGANHFQDRFTERQLSVLDALRKGKPNKVIAHELDLAESTVKIHVRNLMKLLKATNRTQVTYIFNTMRGQVL